MTKIYFTFLSFVLGVVCCFGQMSKTIHVSEAGTLSALLGDNQTKVTNLTLQGTINNQDFTTISKMSALKDLDLSNVNVVNNTMPAGVFKYKTLNSVIIPASIITLQDGAFSQCIINNLDFSKAVNLKNLGARPFTSSKFSKLDFSKCLNLESVGPEAFANLILTEKNEINFSKNVLLKNFGLYHRQSGVFSGYSGHVVLPSNMKEVPKSSFSLFTGSVTLHEGLEVIGANAFDGANPKSEIVLPSTIITFNDNAFTNFVANNLNLTKAVNLKTFGNRVFGNAKFTNLDLSPCVNLESIGAEAFVNLTLGEKNELNLSKNNQLKNFGFFHNQSGVFTGYKGHVILPSAMKEVPAVSFGLFTGSVTLHEGIEVIGKSAFNGASPSPELVLPNSIVTIDEMAFANFVANSLDLSKAVNLKTLGNRAFGNAKFSKFDFSKCVNLQTLGAEAFVNLTLGEKNELNLSKNNQLKNFGFFHNQSGVFTGYKGHVILPSAMKELPGVSFARFFGSVTLHEGLEVIGRDAFNGASPQPEIELPSTITALKERSFANFVANNLDLTKIIKLKSLSHELFTNSKISKLDFSKCVNLESIGPEAFVNLTLTEKNELDFSNCSLLKTFGIWHVTAGTFARYNGHVILPSNMKELPATIFATFYGSVKLPDVLETIGGSAFRNSTIKNIELPVSLKYISTYAFANCSSLEYIISKNPTPPALGPNVFPGVNKSTCILYVPAAGIPLYKVADQWKDFLISEYSSDLRLEGSNLYQVKTDQLFTVKVPAHMTSDLHLGLYSASGHFEEDITVSIDKNIVSCSVSSDIQNGSYNIVPYEIKNGERVIRSRTKGSYSIDRLPITVINDWNAVTSRSITINNNLLFSTGTPYLLEVANNKTFNILVRYANTATPVKLGLFDPLTGAFVSDVNQSVNGSNYTCIVPTNVKEGKYNLIPYQLVSGKPVFVERSLDKSYLVDRLPIAVKSSSSIKSQDVSVSTEKAEILIYPNPTTDVINVSGNDVQQITVCDMSGRQVLQTKSTNTVSVSTLPNGTYIVKVKTASAETTHKIVKK